MSDLLKIQHVSKFYGNVKNMKKALDDVSFSVGEGEFIGIMGASGSGKTTLLHCISTLDEVTAGEVLLDNQNITKLSEKKIAQFRREHLGFVFQDYNLLDTLTLRENISLALTIRKTAYENIDSMIENIAKKLGIDDVLNKFPYEVSGGQKQRCACARALINEPKLLLADEPTGALDSKSSSMLLQSMSSLNKVLSITILMVTHDAISASYCKRIIFLKDGKIFSELYRGEDSQQKFFQDILDTLALLGGEVNHVR